MVGKEGLGRVGEVRVGLGRAGGSTRVVKFTTWQKMSKISPDLF